MTDPGPGGSSAGRPCAGQPPGRGRLRLARSNRSAWPSWAGSPVSRPLANTDQGESCRILLTQIGFKMRNPNHTAPVLQWEPPLC